MYIDFFQYMCGFFIFQPIVQGFTKTKSAEVFIPLEFISGFRLKAKYAL